MQIKIKNKSKQSIPLIGGKILKPFGELILSENYKEQLEKFQKMGLISIEVIK